MEQTVLRVCVTCRRDPTQEVAEGERDGARFLRALESESAALASSGITLDEVRCLSGCKRACTAVMAGTGKWTYVLCDLDPETDAAALLDYTQRFHATDNGQVPWRERPESLRRKTLARIPPLETPQSAKRGEAA
ncbi:MAG: DUF1636 domain-containing protein [Kiloniellales bacterium]